ncbi:hypothetical protein [Amycolatopsis australiensis]|uniref:Uncharacterized protein n=1 Tax=Amycolatopsis australiensis TaxID=546364 RepID=A0A1K1S9F3_9PSEU|nr:hypothetical protein [Amycolatopsis australiensis]SFW80958.1 hypothetical protein SAMN04489730_5090 [Amycolatopsis australiensis]
MTRENDAGDLPTTARRALVVAAAAAGFWLVSWLLSGHADAASRDPEPVGVGVPARSAVAGAVVPRVAPVASSSLPVAEPVGHAVRSAAPVVQAAAPVVSDVVRGAAPLADVAGVAVRPVSGVVRGAAPLVKPVAAVAGAAIAPVSRVVRSVAPVIDPLSDVLRAAEPPIDPVLQVVPPAEPVLGTVAPATTAAAVAQPTPESLPATQAAELQLWRSAGLPRALTAEVGPLAPVSEASRGSARPTAVPRNPAHGTTRPALRTPVAPQPPGPAPGTPPPIPADAASGAGSSIPPAFLAADHGSRVTGALPRSNRDFVPLWRPREPGTGPG